MLMLAHKKAINILGFSNDMIKPDLADDNLVALELCESGPCVESKPKGRSFLKDI